MPTSCPARRIAAILAGCVPSLEASQDWLRAGSCSAALAICPAIVTRWGRPGSARSESAQQARHAAVLEDPAAGLAGRAVVDRVLVVVDLRQRGAAARARLAQPPVHAVEGLVAGAALAALQPARQLRVDRRRQPLDL